MNFYLECLNAATPEVIVVLTALLVLLLDLGLMARKPARQRMRMAAMAACGGIALAIGWLVLRPYPIYGHMLSISPLTQWIKIPMLLLAVFAIILSSQSTFTRHAGEYFAVVLLASAGLMLLVCTDNLLLIFVSLELLSISLYSLAAFDKNSADGSEAALKYLLFGGLSAAFTLFGISLIYGVSGQIQLGEVALKIRGHAIEPIFYVAILMTLVGFAFKLAAAPFHLWAPDVYQSAPTPVAAFIASGSKVASFFVVARILLSAFPGMLGSAVYHGFAPGWMPLVAVLAALSMIVGNVAAIVQTNVKRLLAYSAIAHAGYAMLALLSGKNYAMSSLLYYTITYAFTVLGAFAVVSMVESCGGRGSAFSDFAGLGRRAPLLSFCMLVFVLSLAGIPPLSGFFGKFYIFTGVISATPQMGLLWLVVLGIAASAVSLYYYLQVLKQIYAGEAPAASGWTKPSAGMQAAIVVLALIVVVLGCAPDLVLGTITELVRANSF